MTQAFCHCGTVHQEMIAVVALSLIQLHAKKTFAK